MFYKRTKIKVKMQRIYRRDNYQCVYCGSKKNLTLDHVIPKSRGGLNNWENLATSCAGCNTKKADRTPEEAKMSMSHKPYIPTLIEENINIKCMWEEFRRTFLY